MQSKYGQKILFFNHIFLTSQKNSGYLLHAGVNKSISCAFKLPVVIEKLFF